MSHASTAPAQLSIPPLPPPDQDGTATPERISAILAILAVLIEYGRHLLQTMQQRAARRDFATIAQYFGTASVPVIITHIQRGLMRAIALQYMLLQRARSGCDLRILAPRRDAPYAATQARPPEAPAAASPATPQPPAAAAQRARPRATRRRTPQPLLTSAALPSMAQIETELRRRPVGQSLADICCDLGISPALCTAPFWGCIFAAIHHYRGSFDHIILEMRRREQRFAPEHRRSPQLALPEQTQEGIRRTLGFLVGETPVVPPLRRPPI